MTWLLLSAMTITACSSEFEGSDGDADGDGITNADEGWQDDRNTDGDAYEDYVDLDSDGDGLADAIEAGDDDLATPPVDTDGDGKPDVLDTDSDGDGIFDTAELDANFAPVDTDGDGVPDHLDLDSDGDTIADANESTRDIDADGLGSVRDLDSDGDGRSDAIEAGDADLATPPVDTDADGAPDFVDLDSDGDFLTDAEEDPNGDGVVDPGESSPLASDTDDDGTPDLVESIAGSDPNDATENIPAGDFYFVLPYQGPEAKGALDFTTTVKQADVFVSMDTTGSFGEEIAALQEALQATVVPGIQAVIPDAAFGVGRFEDFPLAPFGCAGDRPYELLRAMTTDVASVSAAIDLLPPASCGLDKPESGYEALYQWASGAGLPDFALPPFAPPGIGGVGFRADALPIVLQITDARSHEASDYAAITSGAHGRDAAVAALTAIGARVIGIDSLENVGTPDDPRAQLEDLAIATKAVIPPDPATNQCNTGVGGAAREPVVVNGAPVCPVVFDVAPDGTGLGDLIVSAVQQLATLGVLDVSTKPVGETQGPKGDVIVPGHTSADFLTAIKPVPPAPMGSTIDGDVFRDVVPGSTVTFEVTAFNDFQPSTSVDQLFSADIQVLGDLVTVLDVRKVYVIVPKATVVPQ
jgi:hypothetical protein